MEVSRRRINFKHLEPARPLRRCFHVEDEPNISAAMFSHNLTEQESNIEQLFKILKLQKQRKNRLCYTREFLIGLASCPEAKKKPLYLPDHPIVLNTPRDPQQEELAACGLWNDGKETLSTGKMLHSS